MKIPISNRLRCCAEFVAPGARVADIGTDHGYLGLYLLQTGRAAQVLAADLREQPLQSARRNAEKYAVGERMAFRLSDGLREIAPDEADTIVCAGMGGDLIVEILSRCGWLHEGDYTLILQPQSAGQVLRRYLVGNGFAIRRETLVEDGKFLYTVLEAHPGEGTPLSPGREYVSPWLEAEGSPLFGRYVDRIAAALKTTVEGLGAAEKADAQRLARLDYYRKALEEVEEIRRKHDNSSGNS